MTEPARKQKTAILGGGCAGVTHADRLAGTACGRVSIIVIDRPRTAAYREERRHAA
jgi:NADH dehydrogenase FAD-containing subunit